jgi:hypothetical protein
MLTRILKPMFVLLVLTGGALSVFQPRAQAQEGAWCIVVTGKDNGYESCSYVTFDQCRAAATGLGFCVPGPGATMPHEGQPTSRRRSPVR